MTAPSRLRVAVWKLTSCDGCQLSLLDCEEDLLQLAEKVEISYFLEATSKTSPGPYDVSLVEGSVTTVQDAERIQELRRASHQLVALGACATAGGIQALRNFSSVREYVARVYPDPELVSTLETSTPLSDHVAVDLELRGCPVDRGQLLEMLTALLRGRRPELPAHSVCFECKRRGNVCVVVAGGNSCLGPVTQAGCGGLCPAVGRGCYGCFGPMETPNTAAMTAVLGRIGVAAPDLVRAFRTFNAAAPSFAAASRLDAAATDGGVEDPR